MIDWDFVLHEPVLKFELKSLEALILVSFGGSCWMLVA